MRKDPRFNHDQTLQPRDYALLELGEAANELESIRAQASVLAVIRRVIARLFHASSLLTEEAQIEKGERRWLK